MWDDNNEITTSVMFTYRSYDSDGNQTGYIERTLYNEEAESLPNIIEMFHCFLLGMTFTYVDSVSALNDEGVELASTG